MSQWGKELSVNGARFIPLVATDGFGPASSRELIFDIISIDDGGSQDQAFETLKILIDKHMNKPYQLWLESCSR